MSAIYDSVILRDVAQRFAIRDFALLKKLVTYVFSTSGNLFSIQKIVNFLNSSGEKTTIPTIESYLDALEDALIIHSARQERLQGKEMLRPLRKFYATDTGIRNLSIGFALKDIGFQLENVVFLELLRCGYKVSVGASSNGEVDFIATRFNEKQYVQVCDQLDEAIMERELEPLRSIRDAYPKLLLTTSRLYTGVTADGIQVINLLDWLLSCEGIPLTTLETLK